MKFFFGDRAGASREIIFYDKLDTNIELSRFVKTDAELGTDLGKWLYVLKNMSQMDKIPTYLRKPVFEKLFSIAAYINLTREEKAMYDNSMKYKWDNQNVLDYAVSTAKAEVREEERLKALEEKKSIARELKKEGLTVAFIAKTTKLSPEEIEKL